jgi:anthranilate synthase/aminodeoxychorismate synthase-like glutamine amidotransferase
VILLIDNFDSFVFNLAQGLGELGQETEVVRCDRIDARGLAERKPSALVISPGPGRPSEAGVSLSAVRAFSGELPILGVCLGHQAIAEAFGGRITRGREPVHGRTSLVTHDGRTPFEGIPSPFEACRYHSLVVDPAALPDCLHPCAFTDGGAIMALRHATHPTFGVQFHPESFRTRHGLEILANFVRAAAATPT